MEYKGKLYGKVGDSLIPLEATTEDFERMEERIKELEGYLSWFCERVEKGEVRSIRTYAKFKEVLGKK